MSDPVSSIPVSDAAGRFATFWYLFLVAIADRVNRLIGAQVAVDEYTLTLASTRIDPPAASSAGEWVVILTQDPTGGRAITWGTGVVAASTAIDTTASTISTFRFVRVESGDWVMVGQPTTGMTA